MELDLLVIGSGPSGQRAAIQAAKLSKRVAVAERRDRLGGVSIHTGTIPSKTLRQAVLSQLAQGQANKIFIIPSEFNQALGNLGNALGGLTGGPPPKPKERNEGADAAADAAAADARSAADAARAAEREASAATTESRLRPGMAPGAIGPGEPPAPEAPPPPPQP